MEFHEFKSEMRKLSFAFSSGKQMAEEQALNWYAYFETCKLKRFTQMLSAIILDSDRFPSISQLNKKLLDFPDLEAGEQKKTDCEECESTGLVRACSSKSEETFNNSYSQVFRCHKCKNWKQNSTFEKLEMWNTAYHTKRGWVYDSRVNAGDDFTSKPILNVIKSVEEKTPMGNEHVRKQTLYNEERRELDS